MSIGNIDKINEGWKWKMKLTKKQIETLNTVAESDKVMENMKGLSVAQIIKEYKELEGWSFNRVLEAAQSGDSEKTLAEILEEAVILCTMVNEWISS